jgi:alkylation response protein AidB-like acyl-CoA dehydrogenase
MTTSHAPSAAGRVLGAPPRGAEFFQDAPALGNQYLADAALRALLRRALPPDVLADVEPGLVRLGERAVTDIRAAGEAAEDQPPRHVPYDAWGRRVDRIETSEAWRTLERIAAEEGIVATAYERAHGALSRVHQLARLYLYAPSSATYSCPLAMTDGAARCLELHAGDDARLRAALARLTARDPARFWTSGQWMTERTGGSDVSGTSTVARPAPDGEGFRLWGAKWFTSATTSQVALTLARIADGAPGAAAPGGAGLSLFYLELRDAGGALRDIRVHRLKEKLGTRALPTAELTLEGTPAILLGGPGDGVRKISALLNVTRLYNACCAAAGMRRAVSLARDYAARRVAFGRPIVEHPLHAETLAALEVECDAALHLVFHLAALLGREECGSASAEESALLRLLTPVAKLYTGKQAVAVASEALEAFGGAGYVEDTRLPQLLRDAQVLSIWEGTTNVLSLDVLRALERSAALAPFLADVRRRLDAVRSPALAPSVGRVRDAAARLARHVGDGAAAGRDALEAGARALSFALARTYAGALLLGHAEWCASPAGDGAAARRAAIVARRWCAGELAPLLAAGEEHRAETGAVIGRE